MFRSQDTQVFVFLTISWFIKSVTSWRVFVHETGCGFEYTTHWVTKLGNWDINNSNKFQESFEHFGRLRLSSRSFSIYEPAAITQ